MARLWPQLRAQIRSDGEWLPFTLVWGAETYDDAQLMLASFARCERALRDKLRANGLNGLAIVAGFDIDWEVFRTADGKFAVGRWSIHVHGFIRTDGRQAEIRSMFRRAFAPTITTNRPFMFSESGPQLGWTKYLIKDPACIGKRIHDPRRRRPYKRQMSNREAEPMMKFLATQRARDRLFLQGYQWQGRGVLVPIKDFGRWSRSEPKADQEEAKSVLTRRGTRNRPKGPERG
ncbi:hypothetical protein ASF08_21710 [Methylobacterium sp. Leaf85]|nr:hypothetical protein ASF08_21710 [Methylobacterium sp. Leaf85]